MDFLRQSILATMSAVSPTSAGIGFFESADMNDINIIAQFDRLWQELCDLSPVSHRDPSGWERLPSPGASPSPWLTWTLIALLRHRQRQLWVGQIMRERLDGDLGLIASGGAFAHPETRPQRGPVPGLPECLDSLDKRWDLAARIGDWPLALAKLPDDADGELRRLIVARSEAVVADRVAEMKAIFEAGEETRLALLGLSDANASDLAAMIRQALRGPISGTTSSALSLINKQSMPNCWCEDVYTLFRRLDPHAQLPEPYLWCESISFLLRHGYRAEEIAAALPSVGRQMVGEAALLSMEHAPQHAVGLLRRALRSSIPANRMTAAASLALIDQPWSRQELWAVLRESDEQELTSECRAAMAESRDPLIRQAVLDWEERNPHEREIGKWITMNEMHLRHTPAWLLYEMDKLRERVLMVSAFEPPQK